MPLLGTTWVLGLLSVNSDTVVFQYLFAIVNSLQVSSASGACTQIMAIYETIYLTFSKFAAKLYFCLSMSNFGRVVWIYVASGAYLDPSEKPYMRRFFYSSQSLTIYESLNGVDRQPSKKFIFYRQPSKMQIDTVKKFQSCFLFLFQLIVMVF